MDENAFQTLLSIHDQHGRLKFVRQIGKAVPTMGNSIHLSGDREIWIAGWTQPALGESYDPPDNPFLRYTHAADTTLSSPPHEEDGLLLKFTYSPRLAEPPELDLIRQFPFPPRSVVSGGDSRVDHEFVAVTGTQPDGEGKEKIFLLGRYKEPTGRHRGVIVTVEDQYGVADHSLVSELPVFHYFYFQDSDTQPHDLVLGPTDGGTAHIVGTARRGDKNVPFLFNYNYASSPGGEFFKDLITTSFPAGPEGGADRDDDDVPDVAEGRDSYKFAFVSNREGLSNIYVSAGGAIEQITTNTRDHVTYKDPAINHNGTKIAYAHTMLPPAFPDSQILYRPIASSSEPLREIIVDPVVNMPVYAPDWAPDSDRLAYVRKVTGNAWGPDYVAMTMDVDPASESFGSLTDNYVLERNRRKEIKRFIWNPAFHSDPAIRTGTEHFLVQKSEISLPADETREVFDIFANDYGVIGYTQRRAIAAYPLDRYDVAISPDGSKIAFVEHIRLVDGSDEKKNITTCDLSYDATGYASCDSSTYSVLVTAGLNESPSFTHDGAYILYDSVVSEGNRDIFMVRTTGRVTPIRLTDHPADDYDPACFPRE